jgi:hypothetical protein
MAYLVNMGALTAAALAFSYDGINREHLWKNKRLMVWVILLCGLFGFLTFSEPNTLNCMFRIQCDTKTSMSMDNPFLKGISATSVGGCMYSPQYAHLVAEIGENYSKEDCPRPENKCQMDRLDWIRGPSPIALGSGSSPDFPGAMNCIGPNNCLPTDGKYFQTALMTSVAVIGIGVTVGLTKWASKHRLKFSL